MSYNPSEVIFKRDYTSVYFTSGATIAIPLDCQKVIVDLWQNGGPQEISTNTIRMRVNGSTASQYSYALRYTNDSTYNYYSTTTTSWPLQLLAKTTPFGNARVTLYPRKDAARYMQGEIEYNHYLNTGVTQQVTGYLRLINTADAITSVKLFCTIANTVSLSIMVRAIK